MSKKTSTLSKKKVTEESSDESSDESSNEVPVVKTKKEKKPVESDSDSSSEEEAPKKKAAKKSKKSKKAKKESSSEESDDESSEEKTKKTKKSKKASKKTVEESDDEEEAAEEEAAPAKEAAPYKEFNERDFEVIVKSIAFAASEGDIKTFFEGYGKIHSLNLLTGPDGRSKGIAFVRYLEESSMKAAIESSGVEFKGRQVWIEKTIPREQRPQRNFNDRFNNNGGEGGGAGGYGQKREYGDRDESSTIFVGNVSFQSSQQDIWNFFEPCGKIVDVRIATHPDGSMRGFAHVQFEDGEAAKSALSKAGQDLGGRALRVDLSGNKGRSNNRGGGGRGYGGNGGGNRW